MYAPDFQTCFALLGIEQSRLNILRLVTKVAKHVLVVQSKDVITPTSLARVIPVSNESVVPDFLPVAGTDFSGMKNLTQELDKWNVTWGLIIANSDVFFEVGLLTL